MAEAIQVYNRYTGEIETEAVYGERWLSFAYGNPLGRVSVWGAARRRWFSRVYGWLMSRPSSVRKVAPFIQRYGLNPEEFAAPDCYTCFNDFFVRRLKPEVRPINLCADAVVFPADGRHLGFQDYRDAAGIVVKGQRFHLDRLLGDWDLAERYERGSLIISRLCPTDYHRFHFPVAGLPGPAKTLPGPLDSVNPLALRRNINILAENRRDLTLIRSERFGLVAMLEVGAACVGTIVQTYKPRQHVEKGAEKGFFKFGGSTTITLFEPGVIKLAGDLVEQSSQFRELYAHMGDVMGTATRRSE